LEGIGAKAKAEAKVKEANDEAKAKEIKGRNEIGKLEAGRNKGKE